MDISIHLHFFGNLFLAAIYLLIVILVTKKLLLPTAFKSLTAFSIGALFLVLMLNFLFQALFTSAWTHPLFEAVWIVGASLPAFLFFILGFRRDFFSSLVETSASRDRFDKLKEEFLSVASHELRTPLSVINGFAEILVREKLGPLNDEQKRRVRKILMQGQRLNRIIDELLDLSRIRRGKIECRRDVFDLVPVLKACLDDHQIVCEQQNIELRDNIPDVLPDVLGDLERVTQVVVNILGNAIKYTEPGGYIAVTASTSEDNRFVTIKVSDSGIGIAAEDQAHVFREFFRAQHRHTRRYSGSGLGLAIVKQLVEAQGGTVTVFSEGLGKGSIFYFTLPLAGEEAPAAPGEKNGPSAPQNPPQSASSS